MYIFQNEPAVVWLEVMNKSLYETVLTWAIVDFSHFISQTEDCLQSNMDRHGSFRAVSCLLLPGGGSRHFLCKQSEGSFQRAGRDHVLPWLPDLHVLCCDGILPVHERRNQRHERSSSQQDRHHDVLVH